MKNILIGCEYSGRVREAFKAKGLNAVSVDILDTEIAGQHYKGDIIEFIKKNGGDFDAMIAFPPCQYLSAAGLHFCNIETHGSKAIERIFKRNKAIEFFLTLYNAPIHKICIENPTGFISAHILKQTQIIHPYYFGEREMKRTCLWLRNLTPLQHEPTDNLFTVRTHSDYPEPKAIKVNKKTGRVKNLYFCDEIVNNQLKTPKEKSLIFQSIANAMAEQWAPII